MFSFFSGWSYNFLICLNFFQLPYIAMYRKEDIYSLLKDPETGEDVSHNKPALRRHKVTMLEI